MTTEFNTDAGEGLTDRLAELGSGTDTPIEGAERMDMTRLMRGILWTVMGLAAVNLLLPFVGPLFGFGMGPDPAFAITASRVTRHVIPDLIVITGAWLMLSGGTRSTRIIGGIAAILAGGWVAVGPHVLAAESVGQLVRRITYHSATGVVLAGLAGVALGALIATRTVDFRGETSDGSVSEKISV